MTKKSIAIFVTVAVLTAQLATPVFAQEGGPNGNPGGFFGFFNQLFSRIFNQRENPGGQQGENQNLTGTPSGEPSEEPTTTGAGRLQGQVTAGKLTQTQEQQVLAEISKIQAEITGWSKSTGLSVGLIYGGLRGPGMSSGLGQEKEGGQKGQNAGPSGFPGGKGGPEGETLNGGGQFGPR